MDKVKKTRYWGLSLASVSLAFVLIIFNIMAGVPSASLPVVVLLLVSAYAAFGKIESIISVTKVMMIITAFVGTIIFAFLVNDTSGQSFLGSPAEFGIWAVVMFLVWLSFFYWAASRRDPAQPRDASTRTVASGLGERTYTTCVLEEVPGPEVSLGASNEYKKAQTALEYRNDLAEAQSFAASKGESCRLEFLRLLNENPQIDSGKLLNDLTTFVEKKSKPFEVGAWNEYYKKLEIHGLAAQEKFKEIASILGNSFDAKAVYEKLAEEFPAKKFSFQDIYKGLPPGTYSVEGNTRFNVYDYGAVMMLMKNNQTCYESFDDSEQFYKKYEGLLVGRVVKRES